VSWMPTADLDDRTMIRAASLRATVRLDTGRIFTLVQWPTPGGGNDTRGRSARLATNLDRRFRVPIGRIVEVDVP